MGNYGETMSTEENFYFVHQTSVSILPAESSDARQEALEKGMMNWAFQSIFVHTYK
jgi:hypothetical protein